MRRLTGLFFAITWLAASLNSAWSQDDPKQVLKDKNLKLVGETVVHADEAKVNKMLGEVAKFRKQLIDAAKERAFAENSVAEKDIVIEQLKQQRRLLNTQLQNVETVEQNIRLVGQLGELTDRINLMEDSEKLEEYATQARNKANVVREAYVDHVMKLRKAYDAVIADYETLAEDADVKAALAELSAEKPDKVFALGPSRAFPQNDAKIKKIEDTVLSEDIPLRKDGSVWWTSVVVNGSKPQEFVVDTGAGLLSIPAKLAEEMDLRPDSQSRTILLKIADGSIIEGKLVFAKTVRVGKFTIENVECAVLPESAVAAEPLLGQSFLGKFTFQLDGNVGTLSMTKVDGEEGNAKPRPTPKPKPEKPAPKGKPGSKKSNDTNDIESSEN
jgi:aspartyl protease family protein